MQFVDTHCHIHFKDYIDDADKVIEDSISEKVAKLICVGCSLADSARAVEFAQKHDNVWVAVGAHPHDGEDFMKDADAGSRLNELAAKPKVVAIGEIGLDYYHENTPRIKQKDALKDQIEIGLSTGLPFVFHIRDAWEDFFKILDNYKNIHGVVHSFSAHKEQLDEVLKRGFYVGLNGIMTFTKDEQQLEAAKSVPLDKLLLETDAPFLTPKPYRGQRCEPWHVTLTAEFLAKLRGEKLEDLASATTSNAIDLFNLT
jgi:TatD DNase family protein